MFEPGVVVSITYSRGVAVGLLVQMRFSLTNANLGVVSAIANVESFRPGDGVLVSNWPGAGRAVIGWWQTVREGAWNWRVKFDAGKAWLQLIEGTIEATALDYFEITSIDPVPSLLSWIAVYPNPQFQPKGNNLLIIITGATGYLFAEIDTNTGGYVSDGLGGYGSLWVGANSVAIKAESPTNIEIRLGTETGALVPFEYETPQLSRTGSVLPPPPTPGI
jgi:hypothetical protein